MMQLQVTKPELEKFITDQVEAGNFPTPEAAVEAAIEQMMHNESELTDEDVEAINESEAQIDRGECVDFDEFAAEMRRKYASQ